MLDLPPGRRLALFTAALLCLAGVGPERGRLGAQIPPIEAMRPRALVPMNIVSFDRVGPVGTVSVNGVLETCYQFADAAEAQAFVAIDPDAQFWDEANHVVIAQVQLEDGELTVGATWPDVSHLPRSGRSVGFRSSGHSYWRLVLTEPEAERFERVQVRGDEIASRTAEIEDIDGSVEILEYRLELGPAIDCPTP